ncbi:hypothetical protein KSP40_PGU020281 [Platanthera guangdongensis]|uniref:SPX domain-containing protein n=1 Tax=Platanthera guangdongensis TaxID=2320717 RepID=A0ABR2MP31_9ASPA
MVKFSKQFGAQLVPEWKDAFVDYWQMKKDLKKLQVLSHNQNSANKSSHEPLSQRLLMPIKKLSFFRDGHRRKHIHRKLASSASKGDLYETELLDQFADTDAARDFFARLDLQLNKVNQFYKGKEKEFVERGDSLRKQMNILVVLKTEMERRRDAKEDQSISDSISCAPRSRCKAVSCSSAPLRFKLFAAVSFRVPPPRSLGPNAACSPTSSPCSLSSVFSLPRSIRLLLRGNNLPSLMATSLPGLRTPVISTSTDKAPPPASCCLCSLLCSS